MPNVKGNLSAPMNLPRQRRRRSRGQVDPFVSDLQPLKLLFCCLLPNNLAIPLINLLLQFVLMDYLLKAHLHKVAARK